jgi:hypothetical protein
MGKKAPPVAGLHESGIGNYRRRSFSTQRILDAADGVLHFSFYLVGLAFRLQLAVAQDFSGGFLQLALGLFGRALNAILEPLAKLRWRAEFFACEGLCVR